MSKEQAIKHNRQATHNLIQYKKNKKAIVIVGIWVGLMGAVTIWNVKTILENA